MTAKKRNNKYQVPIMGQMILYNGQNYARKEA